MHHFRDEHRQLLVKLLQKTKDIDAGKIPDDRRYYFAPDVRHVRAHGPFYRFGGWFGDRPEAIRQRFRRAIGDLVRWELIVAHSQFGGKLSNLALTPAGREQAEQLESEVAVVA